MTDSTCRVLMVYPRFASDSFWVYTPACEIVGARYPTAPLGMITVAAMLPSSWEVRLVNRNTEDLAPGDLEWADMVMTGGMLFQQADSLHIMKMAQALGKPVVVGGPDITSHRYVYRDVDIQILGESEDVIDEFIKAWQGGQRKGVFEAPKFTADVTKSPVPRFDLLKFDHYLYIGVQFSRGCPFTCEFCDIIELYGRKPRTKEPAQLLAELDRLYELGYRGHVDFVDDNLIGNKKAVKAFLPHLKKWLVEHDYPFEFSTEASLNIADDEELLGLMQEANFFAIFVGIESPDTETLNQMRKKQNTRRNIAESIHRIYAHGILRHGRLYRRLRHRKGIDRGADDRLDRGGSDPRKHGRVALRAVEHPARPAPREGRTPAPGPRRSGDRRRRPMHGRPELRYDTATARSLDRLSPRP